MQEADKGRHSANAEREGKEGGSGVSPGRLGGKSVVHASAVGRGLTRVTCDLRC